jgi:streptogramin lyase
MMTRLFIFLASVFLSIQCFPQADSVFHFVKDYRGGISDFTVDNLGNLYFVYQNGQLKKLRPNGDSLAVYNNVRKFGKLYAVDVSNPLKVLLHFKDFNTIVILDRLLNERSVLDLRKHNLLQVKAIGQSYDNNLWIFDELEVKLKKIGDDGRMIDQSNDFRQIFDSTPSP